MSLQKSGRGAKAAKAASGRSAARPAPGGRQVYVQSARSDIYVALLGISLGAIIIGTLLLVLLLNRYEFKTKVSLRSSSPGAGLIARSDAPVGLRMASHIA